MTFGIGPVAKMSDVGRRNIEFVRRYTAQAGLLLLAEDLGDVYSRQPQFISTADWCACASCAAATTWRRCRANTIT